MLAAWMTAAISLTTVRPLAGASLPATGQRISLTPQLMVMGPPGWHAHLRLTTAPLATRDMVQAPPLPIWLRDDPSSVQPFLLAPSGNVEAGLNVLELQEVSDYTAVTAERPLRVRVDTPLTPHEHVLPVAYDPESAFYLPLGHTLHTNGGTEIQIERLPQPAADRRSLTGSIKIFFHKVCSDWFGTSYPYPLLGTLDSYGDYTAARDKVCSQVAAAQRILLYIHGIIGDTRTMATSAYQPALLSASALPALARYYDLILTFDYENIHTPIEENARGLKQRLQEVGLGAGHGKTLHIVAHSMGGLVSRWFVEREGGNTVVQHLVMVGTPNAGSPWPMIQDWATAAIVLGLNGLMAIAWPAKILGALMSAVERVDVTLDQMAPQSALLKNLATSPDPGISYTVLAGNTSLLSAALLDSTIKHRLTRLFEKLSMQHLLHGTATLAFFGEPNDMAVSVASITNVPAFTKLSPPREVRCDHLSYFSTEAGLRALAETLEATE
jgi:pimeloyl-ACP methyl ester carboxylesterase